MLQELIYTGLGASVIIRKKIAKEVKSLQKNKKLKKKDAKLFLESLEKKGKNEDKRIKKHFKKLIRETIDDLGLVSKKDLKKLEKKIKNVEDKDKVNQENVYDEIKEEKIDIEEIK